MPATVPSWPVITAMQERLVETFGARLLSLDLIGPGLEEPQGGRLPDLVAVLTGEDLQALRRIGEAGRGFARRGPPTPLILTPSLIASSCDAFPLEFLDMQARRWHVQGADHFATLTFAAADLRLQCERDLKSTAMALRQRVLHPGRHLHWQASELAEHVVRVLRGYLHLQSQPVARPTPELIASAAARLGLGLDGLSAMHAGSSAWTDFAAFFAEVVALGSAADGW